MDRGALEAILARHGFDDVRWIDPPSIPVAEWVRMKCRFGCDSYGRQACCPPNVPPVDECRRFLAEYASAALIHLRHAVARPEDRGPWARDTNRALLRVERDVFLAGHPKAFVLPMDSCRVCDDCAPRREDCKHPGLARPSPEALGVDVFALARQAGAPIHVLATCDEPMDRYAVLLVE